MHSIVFGRKECIARDYGFGSTVCVCNLTYCDDLDPWVRTGKGVVTVFETTKEGHRFKQTRLAFNDQADNQIVISDDYSIINQTVIVDRNQHYQRIIGFGGAFTDSTGINIDSLPEPLQQRIIDDYFADTGIQYSVGRIPVAGSDFSLRPYSYDDNNNLPDFEFKNFSLTFEDYSLKFPYIKRALKVSPHKVKLFGSTWSPPAWMKNNTKLNRGGYLIGQPGGKYYKAFANYLVKFIDAYRTNGVPIWGLTIENEPVNGQNGNYSFNSLAFTPELQRDFIKNDLGPILEAAGYGLNTTQLMIYDDNINHLYKWAQTVLADPEASKYVSGVAVHWYENNDTNIINLDKVQALDTSKFILSTEAALSEHRLGNWNSVERYASDIIRGLKHHTVGWVDWNMVLDVKGGPNWVNNYCDGPITVSPIDGEYYKNPVFYALGHFSKFISPDSYRLDTHDVHELHNLTTVAFTRPDGGTVLIAHNTGPDIVNLTIVDSNNQFSYQIQDYSIQSFIYYNN